jgi:hypothetical protein
MEIIAVLAVLAFLLVAGIPKAAVDVKRDDVHRKKPESLESVGWDAASGCGFWVLVLVAGALFLFVLGGAELVSLLGDTWFK